LKATKRHLNDAETRLKTVSVEQFAQAIDLGQGLGTLGQARDAQLRTFGQHCAAASQDDSQS
jgi:hypothetical protein